MYNDVTRIPVEGQTRHVSFKKEVGVRVNDLVFGVTVLLNFENVLLTFKYVFMRQKCSM